MTSVIDPVRVHHTSECDAVVSAVGSRHSGLTSAEARERLDAHGPNELAAAARRPAWKRLLDQFRDVLILILLAAAVISFVVSGELKTPAVVLIVVIFNAIIGFVQENRAEASLDALRKMITTATRVRRNGETLAVPTAEVVPGDIVLIEAGDRVPADGRLLTAVNLEIEEAALTGESHPSVKNTDPVDQHDAPVGDRHCMAHMNTTVTRGRAELVVTSTGMNTEIGRIAGLLQGQHTEPTPLQRQLTGLAHSLAALSGIIVALVFVIGLIRGSGFTELLELAVALAVATIPEGLPAVTAVTLAIGVANMARKNAIVKRLASVETLGCTSIICSDKTGTLTMNEMTAVRLVLQNRVHRVTGSGYSPEGTIEQVPGDSPLVRTSALMALALCNDSVVRNENDQWVLVGDPTEGALTVLAAKGGIDVSDVRQRHPRLAEMPFDSAVKMMATFHLLPDSDGRESVHVLVKGAPDVILSRSVNSIDEGGRSVPISGLNAAISAHNDELASSGMRVLALAQREVDPADWDEFLSSGGDPLAMVNDLTLVALVGIVDPPRPEAKAAIAEARAAGVTVKMITGDHALTAAAIGEQLGLAEGHLVAVTGRDLDAMDDAELDRRIDDINVFARVAPEHKLRLVTALQKRGNVVAMTGDGVNDAPALKRADIGIAMGITGTEVTKEAATMVLTDDNFATIVGAVKRGRMIYDNIVKFVRFQLSTTIGFALLFLLASVFDIASGKPFGAIAILWVNIIMDGPPAMALGLDPADDDIMTRPPRPMSEKILTRDRWTAIALSAVVMALGTLAILEFADDKTMAFNAFVLFQFFNILNSRSDTLSVFRRHTFTNVRLWIALGAVLLLQVAVTHVSQVEKLFDTAPISLGQWLIAIAVASSVLWFEEVRKLIKRRRNTR